MNKWLLALIAPLSLTACADDYYGPGPYAGGPAPVYDAYYDGYYGQFYDGYWGPRGVFYYSRGPRGRYIPDRRGHFRRDVGPGGNWNNVHGHGPEGGFRGHGRGRGPH